MGKTIKDSLRSRGPVREHDDRAATRRLLKVVFAARVPRESKQPPKREDGQ
jgi:hypothetical protein